MTQQTTVTHVPDVTMPDSGYPRQGWSLGSQEANLHKTIRLDSGAHYTPRQTTHQQGSLLTPVRVVSHSPLKCDVSSFLSSLLITLVNCSRLTSVDWNSSRDQIMTHFVQFSWYPDDSITRPKCCRAGAGYNYSVMTPADGIVMAPPDLGHPHPHNLGRPRYYLPIFCPRYVSCATKTTHILILEEMENLLAP